VKPAYIISLCGTSCLTNVAGDLRRMVTKHANAPDASHMPEQDRAELEKLIDKVRDNLNTASLEQARKLSAEINSLTAFYEGDFCKGRMDQHVLIHTDTWLGKAAAECICNALKALGIINVQTISFGGLRTDSMVNFRAALGEMARWCHYNIPSKGVHVVFNLTGGFKSVQGFMQTLGLFYADERVYLFEGSNELLRIPRLPVRMDATEDVKNHLRTIRRLSLDLSTDGDVPDLYVHKIDGEHFLSEWGELVWQQEKDAIYRERLWPEASERYRYADKFVKRVESLPGDRKLQVNLRMDELARYLELSDKPNPKSLNFKALQGNPCPPCTHEFRAWSDGNASRIFGWFDDNVFIVDRLEKHL
jgi:putative CRISPR-associated protein (TIGR02619 family)